MKDYIYYIMIRMDDKYYSLPPINEASPLNDCYSTPEEAREAALRMGYHPEEIDVWSWEVD